MPPLYRMIKALTDLNRYL